MSDNTFLGLPVTGMDVGHTLKRSVDAAGRKLDLFTAITAQQQYPPEALAGLFYSAHVYRVAKDALELHERPATA